MSKSITQPSLLLAKIGAPYITEMNTTAMSNKNNANGSKLVIIDQLGHYSHLANRKEQRKLLPSVVSTAAPSSKWMQRGANFY